MFSAVEHTRVWILPERNDGDLRRSDRDGSAVAESRKDGGDGSGIDVRRGRKRNAGIGDSVDERDADQLQPGERNDKPARSERGSEPAWERIPGDVLWRAGVVDCNDELQCGRQQRIPGILPVNVVRTGLGSESADSVLSDAE
jgi:hypothetical protein